jgi:hypothetical protein
VFCSVSWPEPGDRLLLREEDPFFSQVRGLSAFLASQTSNNEELSLFLDQFAYIHKKILSFITASDGHGAK